MEAKLTDEIERLRAALAVFADPATWEDLGEQGWLWYGERGSPIEFAKAALEAT